MTLTDHPPIDPFSPDVVYEALSNPRRRHVLACLAEKRGPVGFEELVDLVVSCESPSSSDPGFRSSVRTSLYHVHLPKLTDGGLLEFDRDRWLVRATGATAVSRAFSLSDRSVAE